MKHTLFPVTELPPGAIRGADIDDKLRVVVVHTEDGQLYALRDRCPHKGAKLSYGVLHHFVDGDDVGRYEIDRRYMLRCPWHGLEFDLASGACLADEGSRVRSYSVRIEDGDVVLER
jgi:nitrite reductase/ring-hydroxylating ferredoxin subunit